MCVTFTQPLFVAGLHRLRDRGEDPGSGEWTFAVTVWSYGTHLSCPPFPVMCSVCVGVCVCVCVYFSFVYAAQDRPLPVLDNTLCWLSSASQTS